MRLCLVVFAINILNILFTLTRFIEKTVIRLNY